MNLAARAVEWRMLRALAVLRVVVCVNTLALSAYRGVDKFDHPRWGYVVLGAVVVWTAVMTVATIRRNRAAWLFAADLAVAASMLILTPIIKGPWFNATIPGYWVMAALVGFSIRFRTLGGLVAGLLLGGLDLFLREDISTSSYSGFFLLVVGGPIVGFMCGSLQQMAAERDRAERAAAAAAERARLARAVHDGVLQVLALVQRRGAEIGGEAAELARLAGDQESRLRTLIRSQDAVSPEAEGGVRDLSALLDGFSLRPGVHVSTPGGAVDLPAAAASEVAAVVGACLDNVARHVGEGEPAWVLLEAFPDRVEVSVRDDGPGIAEGRLAEAEREGRLGVSGSIRGRIADLGGRAELTTGSFGTEWEFVVPRKEPA